MKITKAFRQKDTRALIGFIDNANCIKVDFWAHRQDVCLENTNINYYIEDVENYEEITLSSFNRALRVVKAIIDNKVNDLIK